MVGSKIKEFFLQEEAKSLQKREEYKKKKEEKRKKKEEEKMKKEERKREQKPLLLYDGPFGCFRYSPDG